ncbi:lysylphosphatidylglycerol synthase transmembrane domain-containing protein [Corallibacter sp.]|uniref:lysylphosphatidylglycerol synthase transmembrane domain-containing protein n=1 Tax=Corallibacter sp. TaxID=2038084 RepID=UPI003AB1876B
MNSKTKSILKISLPILLGVFLIWYSLSKVPFNELLEYFKNANYYWVFLGVFFGFLSHLSRAYRWLYLLEPMGYKPKFPNSIMAVFSAYLINYTVPRAGEVARASVLTTYEQVPFEKGFGTIVAERVADMILLLLIVAIALFLQFDYIYAFFIDRFNPFTIAFALAFLAIMFGLLILFINKSQSAFAIKIKNFIKGLKEGVFSIFKMKKKWQFMAHTIFIWIMYVLMFYVTTFAVAELHGIAFGAILIGFISASFSIAATNGGIGSYPVAIFAAFAVFGIAQSPSIAFGWIAWSSQTLMLVICGGFSLIFLPLYNKKRL